MSRLILPTERFLPFAAALMLMGVASAETTTGAPPEIKLNWNHGLMTLPVEIQSKKGGLMVDTGAGATSLCDRLAKELNVTLKELEGAQGKGIAGDLGKIMQGQVGIAVPGQKADAFPKLSGPHTFIPIAAVDDNPADFGVIGLDDLSSAGAVVDCLKGTMRLDPSGDFRAPEGFLEIPMTRRNVGFETEKEREFVWTLPVRVNGKNGVMVVDTGAATTVLDQTFAKQAGIDLAKSDAIARGAGEGQQELTEGTTEMILGGTIALGGIPVHGTDLSELSRNTEQADGSGAPIAGILGMDQMHRVRALLDCKRGTFFSASKAMNGEMDPDLLMKAIPALVERGDAQAIQLQDDAVKNQGNLALDPLEASQLIVRARSLGLIKDEAPSPDKAPAPKKDAFAGLATAIQKLAEQGDEEAKKCLADAAANNGQLKLNSKQAEELIARAREKGLLDKPSDS